MSGRSMSIDKDHQMRAITMVAPTSAQNPRATPATKLGQSIFQGERMYSINSEIPIASMASMSHSIFSTCLFVRCSMEVFLAVGIFLSCVFSETDFSIPEV